MTAELDDATFSVVRRGYDRAQVDDRVARLSAELDAAAAGRNAAVEDVRTLTRQRDASRNEAQAARSAGSELRAEVERLRAQVSELSIIPHTVDGMSERLQQMVRIAQDEVNDMRSRATTGAAQVLTLAQAEADELRERSATERREFEEERRAAEESLRAQLDETQTRLDQLRHDSDGQMARLDAELAERRTRAEQGLAAEIDEQRSSMQKELAALEARHKEEAARILEVANQDARSRQAEATSEAQRVRAEARNDVGVAQRELEELRVLQHQISEQLTSVRALLDWTLPQISAGARGGSGDKGPRSAGNEPHTPTAHTPTAHTPTSQAPTSQAPTAQAATSPAPTAQAPTAAQIPTQQIPTTAVPTTAVPATAVPSTAVPAGMADRSAIRGERPESRPERDSADTRTPPHPEPAVALEQPGAGEQSNPERPTPVARHSRITAPTGRR